MSLHNFNSCYQIERYKFTKLNHSYNPNLKKIVSETTLIDKNDIKYERHNSYKVIDENHIESVFYGFKHSTMKNHSNGKASITRNIDGFTVTVYDENEKLLNTSIYKKDIID